MSKQAILNKLKARAAKYTSPDGHLCLFMSQIKPIRHDWTITELERTRPRLRWVHENGETVFAPPEQVKLEKLRQKKMNDDEPLFTGWTEEYLWTDLESTFVVLEGYVIDIEFTGDLTPEQSRLRDYWEERTGVITDDFAVFEYAFATDLMNLVWQAFTETRPKKFAAPSALSNPASVEGTPATDPE